MNSLKNFFKGLFDSQGNISSKRVVGVGAFALIVIATIADIYDKKFTISEFIFFGVLSILFACFGLNTFLTSKSMNVKENVATDMIDANKPGANEDAKDVLNSDKP